MGEWSKCHLKGKSLWKWANGLKINDTEKIDPRCRFAPTPGQYTCIAIIFKDLLLWNRLANQSQTSCGAFLGRENERLMILKLGMCYVPLHHSFIRDYLWCVASINSKAIRFNASYTNKYSLWLAASGSWLFGSVVRALDFYPGSPGSNPIRDVGFFSNCASYLYYEFSYS